MKKYFQTVKKNVFTFQAVLNFIVFKVKLASSDLEDAFKLTPPSFSRDNSNFFENGTVQAF